MATLAEDQCSCRSLHMKDDDDSGGGGGVIVEEHIFLVLIFTVLPISCAV